MDIAVGQLRAGVRLRAIVVLALGAVGCGASSGSGAGGATGAPGGSPGAGGIGTGGAHGVMDAGGLTGGSSGGTSGAAGSIVPSTGGTAGSGPGGTIASGGAIGSGGTGNSGGAGGSGGVAALAFSADRVTVTGVRGTATPPATSTITLHNAGSASVQISALSLGSTSQLALGPGGMPVQASPTPVGGASLFQIVNAPALPATVAAGGDLSVTVQLLTTAANLPAPPSDKNTGSTFVTASLTASFSGGSAQAMVYGLVLSQANYEPTLGQILICLGYKLAVGQAQNNWNPNTSMNAMNLPGVEKGTDEVAAPLFVKAGGGMVTLTVVARFSPAGVLPYGWYSPGDATKLNTVGTMSMAADAQTSDKARMVDPPLQAGSATTFDPGSGSFGIWVYSDQKTEKYNEGGNTANGDYDYTQDALNTPAGVHRVKVYALKNASGTTVPQRYLLAIEEAGNGDYQDYVLLLGNVDLAP